MARGFGVRFLSGALTGGVASTVVAGVVSVLAPPPMAPEVSSAAPGSVSPAQAEIPADSGKTGSQTDTALTSPAVAPQTLAPDPDSVVEIDSATQETAALPETGTAEALDPPTAPAQTATAPDAEAPVLPNPQAVAPVQPRAEAQATISTDPAQPPAPRDATDEAALAGNETLTTPQPGAPDDSTSAKADLTPDAERAPEPDPAPEVAEEQTEEVTTPPAQNDTTEAPVIAEADEAPVPQEEDTNTQSAAAPDVPQITEEAAPQPDAARQTEAETGDTVVAAAGPAVGTPATSLLDRDTGVTINRPQSTDTTEAAVAPDTAVPTLTPTPDSARPIDLYAQPFDAADDKPLMSIVLIDDGTTPTAGAAGIAALRSFPYPLSFAVDSRLEDAADRIALYRDKGFEVMVMINMPPGAQAVDAETTFGVVLSDLKEVVGVLEGTETGFQESRDLSDQVSAIVAQTGHGLLTQSRGLNTMPKLARKEGVPAAPVFRDFDSKDQTATVIRRFLDQAAFKAGQEGAVVMLGRMRPDTISALLLWGLQDRASSVALSPISAVLNRDP